MSAILGFTTARKEARCTVLAGWLDGGTIEVYTADRPETSDTEITDQTLLVIFDLPDPAGTVSDDTLTGSQLDMAIIIATGTAAWCRVKDADDVPIGDGDVGLTDSGSFIELDNLSLVEGGYCSATSFAIIEG